MSVSKSSRRRVSLLASSSLVAASLIAGVAGLTTLAVAPGVALAADECGDPSANAGAGDNFTCAGAYVTIDYTTTTNGNLALNLQDGVIVTNGIAVTGNAGETLQVRATTLVVGAGDPTVLNPAGYAINVQGQGPGVNIDLRNNDADAPTVIGGLRGINATNTAGIVEVRMNQGSITATAGMGVNAVGSGNVDIDLLGGATVTSTGVSVRAVSTGGAVDVHTTGLVSSSNSTGIFASAVGDLSIRSGAVTAAGGPGIDAYTSGGTLDVTTLGAVSGLIGIETHSTSAGLTTIDLGGTVTGTAGHGVSAIVGAGGLTLDADGFTISGTAGHGVNVSSIGNGAVVLNLADVSGDDGVNVVATAGSATITVTSTGVVTANNGVGVSVTSNGAATVTVNDVNATGGYGVLVDSNDAATINVNGAVTGGGGVAAQSGGAADATVNLLAGSSVTATNPFSYGVFAQATGTGDAILSFEGDVIDGGVGGFTSSGAVNVTGGGNIGITSNFDAIELASSSGAITVNLTGDINAGGTGDGIDAFSTSGAINITLGGTVTAGGDGVEATSGNDVTVTVNGAITAGGNGVDVVSSGAGTVTVAGDVSGDNGVQVTTVGAGDATIEVVAGGSVTATSVGGFGALASTSGSGDAVLIIEGDVLEGGVGAFASGTGDVSVTGAGSINVTGAFAAVDTLSTSGATNINLSGIITSGGDGINALTIDGALTIQTSGAIVAGVDGIEASSDTGAVSVTTTGGSITSGADGIFAGSNGSVTIISSATIVAGGTGIAGVTGGFDLLDITVNGSTTGADGVTATALGTGGVFINTTASGDITGTAGDGIFASTGSGLLFVNQFGAVSGTDDGMELTTVDGGILALTGPGDVTGGAGSGIEAVSTGAGSINIVDFGATISGTTGVVASASGTGSVGLSLSAVTSTGGDAINASAVSGGVLVILSGPISATGGDGVDASTSGGGGVEVIGTGSIDASNGYGILAQTNGGAVTIAYTGDIGTVGDPTQLGGALGQINSGTGAINVSVVGDVYTLGTGALEVGVAGVHQGTAGDVNVVYQGTLGGAPIVGVGAGIFNAANSGNATVFIGDGSSITAGVIGVTAQTDGTGDATIILGTGVTIDPDDYGAYSSSAGGDATIVGGDGTTIVVGNTDGDTIAFGALAESGAAADTAVGDEAVEIAFGANLSVTVDDGAGGDADGAGGVIGIATGAAGSVDIDIGNGLSVTITGNSAIGVGGNTVGGDIFITTGTGTIDILGLNNVDTAGNFLGTAGIGARSASGDIVISSATNIAVNNGVLDAAGILAATGGAGTIVLVSNGQILSSDLGISAEAVDGDILVVNNGVVGATNSGIVGLSTGTGDLTVVNTNSVTATLDNGISATNTGADGFVLVSSTGPAITAGFDGIAAVNTNALSTGIVQVNNSSTITANTAGGGGYGIFAVQAGNGGILINSAGTIAGTAERGISTTNTGTTGTTTILHTAGTIGTSANPVNGIGIFANASSGAAIVIQTSGGAIWAEDTGISATSLSTGAVTISTSGGSVNTTAAASTGIFASGAGGLVQVANNVAVNSAGTGISVSNVAGALSVGTSGAVTATGGDAIVTSNTTGASTIFTVVGGNLIASDDGIDASSTTGAIDIDTVGTIVAGDVGIQAIASGAGVITIDTAAASTITATSDGIFASSGGGAVTILTGGAIGAGGDGIQVTNTTGAIDIDTVGTIVAGDVGILATATGAGVITIDTGAASTITSTGDGIIASSAGGAVTIVTRASVGAGGDGIQAATTGATLTVTNNATVTGGANGILTSNGGTGVTNLNVNQNVTATGAGLAAINASTTGTGTITVAIANGRTIQDVNGSAIRTASTGGAVSINTGTGSTIVGAGAGATSWVVDMANAAGGTSTLTIGTGTTVRSTDNTIAGYDDAAIRGSGGAYVVSNAGRINGRVAFAGGGTTSVGMTNTGEWHTTGASTFSGGADTLTNSATGRIFTNANGVATSFDFGAGADVFANAGLLVVGEPTLGASTLTITGLETWNNSGRIVFGSTGTTLTAVSDGAIDDRILASGATFTGSGSSLLAMDANLGATTQTSCAVLAAADCLSLTGGSTAGSTSILVNDISPNAFGAFNPTGIVLVDVSGAGTTAATHFSLNAASDFWRADLNSADGVLDKGLFFYDLTLNGNKQHVLVGLPDGEAFEFTTFGQSVQNIWYTTTGTWFERQADLRDQLEGIDGQGAGIWVKIAGSSAERDLENSYDLFGVTYSFDTSYDQSTVALIGGLDFMGGGSGRAWVIGGQIGFVDSNVNFDASPTMTAFDGMTYGLYGTYVSGQFFVDAIVNGNSLDYSHQAVSLNPAGPNIYSGSVNSLGVQVEGGWSMPLGANGFFEPLGSFAYVSSDIDAVSLPGATIDWDDQTSMRLSLGGRVGLNADHGTFSSKWSVVARYWNEFEDSNGILITSAGPDLALGDDFSGSFGEVGGSVNVFGADDRFSAFLNLGVKFKDDYQSTDASLGLRWRW